MGLYTFPILSAEADQHEDVRERIIWKHWGFSRVDSLWNVYFKFTHFINFPYSIILPANTRL